MSDATVEPSPARRDRRPAHGQPPATPPTPGTTLETSTDRYPPLLDIGGVEIRPHVGEPGPGLRWALANAGRSDTAASAVAYYERRCADLQAQYAAVLAAEAGELAKRPDDAEWARQVAGACEQQFAAINETWARSMRDLDAGISARHRDHCRELLIYAGAVVTAASAVWVALDIASGLLPG